MKHTIRINGKIKQIDCELVSGILDKNGKNMVEGDIVKDNMDNEFTVAFIPTAVTYCSELSRDLEYWADAFEVIGHVEDKQ